jgi:flavin reductase (DIM6/NTAB) family NADH-FMN oxidoreductase RutF
MIQIDPNSLKQLEKYKLLIGSILPRPIAFVSTQGEKGSNVAPFSFFTCVSTNPPMIGFTLMPGPFGPKDTLRNIQSTQEFVVNIVSKDLIEQVNISSVDSPLGVSEFELSGLTERPSIKVKPPSVGETKIQLECKLNKIIEFGNGPDSFIVGEVILFNISEEILLDRYHISLEGLKPVGRLGGNLYSTSHNVISVKRKQYQELGK